MGWQVPRIHGKVVMKLGRVIFIGYCVIGLLYAIYAHFWGPEPFRSFWFHLGAGLVWPAAMFPALGKWLGGIIIVAVISFLMAS